MLKLTEGYRLLAKNETPMKGDAWTSTPNDVWCSIIEPQRFRVGDSESCFRYQRKIRWHSKGVRYLDVGEILLPTDTYVSESGYTRLAGTSVRPGWDTAYTRARDGGPFVVKPKHKSASTHLPNDVSVNPSCGCGRHDIPVGADPYQAHREFMAGSRHCPEDPDSSLGRIESVWVPKSVATFVENQYEPQGMTADLLTESILGYQYDVEDGQR